MRIQTDRDRAILWARRILETNFVVLDTETTGLHPEHGDQAITIGVVSKTGKILLDAQIRATVPISREAEAKHGITTAQALKFPPFIESHPHLVRVTKGKTVVAYSVRGYDERIIRSTCEAHRYPVLEFHEFEEALYPASIIIGDWNEHHDNYKWQSLETAARYFDINVAALGSDQAHNAVTDCLTTLRVIEAMAALSLTEDIE